jgi:HEAT repeat protein
LVLAVARGGTADADPGATDEQILKKANLNVDSTALLQYLRQMAQIETRPTEDLAVSAAAIRLLARRRAVGAAEALLGYVPSTTDDLLGEEIESALTALAFRGGSPEGALLQALTDQSPERRVRAGLALCRARKYPPAPEVRPLLKDPDPVVRLRIAAALADRNEEQAVPVLIALLVELPADQAWQAEEALGRLAGGLAPTVNLTAEEAGKAAGYRQCREAWERWWRANDGPALVKLFREWTPHDGDGDRIRALVRQLGDDAFVVRERATAALIQLGGAATPALRQAAKDPDAEVVFRSQRCLREIEKGSVLVVPLGVARLLALRKPAGAAEVLLDYLPIAEDSGADEIQDALAAVAVREGEPQPVLLRALQDKAPLRRAGAAVAVCRGGEPRWAAAVRPLLKDPEPAVRLRVALALADLGEKDALPVLIALLKELPAAQVWQVEEFLRPLAGENAPKAAGGGDEPSRTKYQEAWQAWWRGHGAGLDLVHREVRPRALGYTLVAEWTQGRQGRVLELGMNRKTRWQMEKTPWSLDSQLLPGNRVLLAEFYDERISERTLKGEVLWEKKVTQRPVAVQRLPNGHTFIACANQILEVDRGGKEVVNLQRVNLWAAKKLRDGRIACILAPDKFSLLDATGTELKSFRIEGFGNYCGFDVLPGGGILVPQTAGNEVVEYDPEGRISWKASVERPSGVERLPGGNTLVACRDAQQVVELDRAGKVVWQYKSNGFPWRAHRR